MIFRARDSLVVVGPSHLRISFPLTPLTEPKSTSATEIEGLLSILQLYGVKTARCSWVWPRDNFIFHNDSLHTKKSVGGFAEGGGFVFGKDFVIAPDSLPSIVHMSKEKTSAKLRDLYNISRVHFVPTSFDLSGRVDHVDLFVLLLSSLNLLFVDSFVYDMDRSSFDRIAYREGLTVRSVDSFQSNFGANSIDFLDDCGKTIIITPKPTFCSVTDEKTGRIYDVPEADFPNRLSRLVDPTDALVIELPFGQTHLSRGSIRCKTNVLPADFDLALITGLCDD